MNKDIQEVIKYLRAGGHHELAASMENLQEYHKATLANSNGWMDKFILEQAKTEVYERILYKGLTVNVYQDNVERPSLAELIEKQIDQNFGFDEEKKKADIDLETGYDEVGDRRIMTEESTRQQLDDLTQEFLGEYIRGYDTAKQVGQNVDYHTFDTVVSFLDEMAQLLTKAINEHSEMLLSKLPEKDLRIDHPNPQVKHRARGFNESLESVRTIITSNKVGGDSE